MRIEIDENRCIGAGQCVMTADEVFDQRREDGRAFVLADASPDEHAGAVRAAAEVCPTGAITVHDD